MRGAVGRIVLVLCLGAALVPRAAHAQERGVGPWAIASESMPPRPAPSPASRAAFDETLDAGRLIAVGAALMTTGTIMAAAMGRSAGCHDRDRPLTIPVVGGAATAAVGLGLTVGGAIAWSRAPDREARRRVSLRLPLLFLGTAMLSAAALFAVSAPVYFGCVSS